MMMDYGEASNSISELFNQSLSQILFVTDCDSDWQVKKKLFQTFAY